MRILVPLLVDVVLVILFCAIGRRSHEEAVLAGLLRTAWPFAAGLALGWLGALLLARRTADAFDGSALWPSGVLIWAVTLAGGMALRAVSGQGTAFSFVLVATGVLALFLLGWRAAVSALG
ncbi:DUF3054 domain-containing protein [Nocardia jiangsuensis]|uniref:DUF3054 domain-containing protein n=1 Tax=Nocardia jiangsuensis TaxID=1691563 RepID=A0ABV8DUA1_9NOCA